MKADKSLAVLSRLLRDWRNVNVALITLLLSVPDSVAENEGRIRNILILYSDSRSLPAFALLDQSLRETLQSSATVRPAIDPHQRVGAARQVCRALIAAPHQTAGSTDGKELNHAQSPPRR